MTELIPGILLTWAAIWILFAFTTNLLYPLIRPVVMELHPATASSLLLRWITLPAFSALLSSLLIFSPILSLILNDTQCGTGSCGIVASVAHLVQLPAVIIGFWLLLSSTGIFWHYWLPAHRLARQLRYTCATGKRCSLLPADMPAAFTLGWFSPRIYLTSGLLERCDDEDIACIMNHDQAHQRRRDNLNQLLCRMLTSVLPGRLIQRQLDDYNLLCEWACDLDSTAFQPADQIASTLLKVTRLQPAIRRSHLCRRPYWRASYRNTEART
ncbi:MAG: Zn-dependent protease with chaperone function [Bacteroidia bacterium]|jgi:Zn-dependent protease with chaperone function